MSPGEETRERLLDASEQLFAEQGFAATTVRQIIDRAGVANGAAVGYHFQGKDRLYEAVLDRLLEPVYRDWDANLERLADAETAPTPTEVLESFFRPVVSLQRGHRARQSARLLGRHLSETEPGASGFAAGASGELVKRTLAQLARAAPSLSEAERSWRFWAAVGVLQSYVFGLCRPGGARASEDTVTAGLVGFATAGVEATAKAPTPARARR